MIFTREDILKIQNALLQLGRKDSEFKDANTPLNSDDEIAILQDGINKKVSINNLLSTLGLLKKDDFINVSDRYDEYYIQLSEAITIIANNKRKKGLVITFQDLHGDWKICQFNGELDKFIDTNYWKDLFDFKYPIINSILPDEEDLTLTYPDNSNNSFIKFKDKDYDPDAFSGKGYKILRKNIINEENILTQEMINKENTIYEIRYDFNLNGETIEIPKNCILKFNGGKLYNGYIKGSLENDIIRLKDFSVEDIGLFFENYKPIDGQKIVFHKKTYICSKKITLSNKYIEIDGNGSTIISNIDKEDEIKADISFSSKEVYTYTGLSLSSDNNYLYNIIVNAEIIKNVQVGDIIKIRTNNVYLNDYYPESLYSIVNKIDRENNIIYINDAYNFNSIYEIVIIRPIVVKVYNFTYISKGAYNVAINCNGVINSSFENLSLIGNGALTGLQVSGINNSIKKCNIKDFSDIDKIGITGYGINVTGNNNIVEQNNVNNCRHNITSAERSYLSKNIIITNNHVSTDGTIAGIYNASIDVHACCEAIITNNTIDVVDTYAFQIRSNNTIFSNNTINTINNKNEHKAIAQLFELVNNCVITENTFNAVERAYIEYIYISSAFSNTKNISLCNNKFNNIYIRIGELSNTNISINKNILNCKKYRFIDGQNDLSNGIFIDINNNIVSNNNKALYGGREVNKLNSLYITNNIFKQNISFIEDDFSEEIANLVIVNNIFQGTYKLPNNSNFLFYNNTKSDKIINKVGLNSDIINQPSGDYYIDTKFSKPYFKNNNGIYIDAEGNNYGIYKRGNTDNRPTTEQGANNGFLYFDTDLGKYIVKKFQSKDYYVDILGNTAGIKYKGTFAERPQVTSTKFLQDNFMYFCTDLESPETGNIGIPIFYKQQGEMANAIWVDYQGREVKSTYTRDYRKHGTFDEKPNDINIGFAYFCTDKQTAEGTINGIMIYHKGNNIWVDAFGRVVN